MVEMGKNYYLFPKAVFSLNSPIPHVVWYDSYPIYNLDIPYR
jgi:hypothetical protein